MALGVMESGAIMTREAKHYVTRAFVFGIGVSSGRSVDDFNTDGISSLGPSVGPSVFF